MDPVLYYSDPRVGQRIADACRFRYCMIRNRDGKVVRHFSPRALKTIQRYELSLWRPDIDNPRIELHRHDGVSDPRSIAWMAQNEEAIEIVPDMSRLHDIKRSPYCCVDLDPKVDVPLPKLIELTDIVATQTAPGGPLGSLLPVVGQKFRWTGNRSFHIWSVFNKPIEFESIRTALEKVLEPVCSIFPILSLDLQRPDGVYVDIKVNASGKAVRSLYSLHYKTGMACVPVPKLANFDIRSAQPERVLETGPSAEAF